MHTALANGGSEANRRELDFYPTPPEVTHALMQQLQLPSNSLIWEPACGNGAMSRVLEVYCPNVRSSDLRSTGYGEGALDFLKHSYPCDAVITNPPFNVSEQFILHALKQAPKVAMLLKSQYWHAKKREALFKEHPPAWVLALTWRPDFRFDQRVDGQRGAPTMEVVWTVWEKGNTDTRYRVLQKPSGNQLPAAA